MSVRTGSDDKHRRSPRLVNRPLSELHLTDKLMHISQVGRHRRPNLVRASW
jgi:hypothetical protein